MRIPLAVLLGLMMLTGCTTTQRANRADIQRALLLHSSFDGGYDADFAVGDGRLHTVVGKTEAKPGLHRGDVSVAKGQGRYGDALRFDKRGPVTFYPGEKNAGFEAKNFDGSFSVWLQLDPDKDLSGYCDPVQITDKSPTDEGIFIEFTKDAPRNFRMVPAPSKSLWNPDNRKYEEMPLSERPVLEVPATDFGRGKWTHVVVTWEKFNTGGKDGVATLYINGTKRGTITGWKQVYNWDPARTQIKVALAYVGLYDEFAVFNRALSGAEVRELYSLPNGVQSLR